LHSSAPPEQMREQMGGEGGRASPGLREVFKTREIGEIEERAGGGGGGERLPGTTMMLRRNGFSAWEGGRGARLVAGEAEELRAPVGRAPARRRRRPATALAAPRDEGRPTHASG
jgi:hypothetical protein